MGPLNFDHIKRLMKETSDYIKLFLLYNTGFGDPKKGHDPPVEKHCFIGLIPDLKSVMR